MQGARPASAGFLFCGCAAANCGHGDPLAPAERREGRVAGLTATVEKMTSVSAGLMEGAGELRGQPAAARRGRMLQARPFSGDRSSRKPNSPGRRPGGCRPPHLDLRGLATGARPDDAWVERRPNRYIPRLRAVTTDRIC